MLNLKELEASLDEALEKETAESLADWFNKQADENYKNKGNIDFSIQVESANRILNKSNLTRRTSEELKEARCKAYEYLIE